MENKALELLKRLVKAIDDCNEPDQLDGYLNFLARDFNEELEELGVQTIGKHGEFADEEY